MGAVVAFIFIGILVVICWLLWTHRCELGVHKWTTWSAPGENIFKEKDYYGYSKTIWTQDRICKRCNRKDIKKFRAK